MSDIHDFITVLRLRGRILGRRENLEHERIIFAITTMMNFINDFDCQNI